MKTIHKLIGVIFLSCVSACSSKLEDPTAADPAQMLSLAVSKTTMKSNGADSIAVSASVPKAAGIIDVTFTATHGKFVYSATNSVKQMTTVLNGDFRFAITTLKADTSTGPVYITAETTTQRARIQINVIK